MDKLKIEALKALGIDQKTIDALVADVQQTEKSAEAQHVRYKGMSGREQVFAELLTGGLAQVEDRLWGLYANGRFKEAASLASELLATTKAATGPKPQQPQSDAFSQALMGSLESDGRPR